MVLISYFCYKGDDSDNIYSGSVSIEINNGDSSENFLERMVLGIVVI